MGSGKSGRRRRSAAVLTALACVALGAGLAGPARPAASDSVTITLLASATNQTALQVLIANFERVYPDVTVQATYAPSSTVNQVETTELAAGDAPDLLSTFPGCGTPVSVCELAKAGDLAPLVKVPWTKRSLPLVTSLSKWGPALYVFEPQVSPYGIFTNDSLFAKLGLKVPQTFAQLLGVCARSKAGGLSALILGNGVGISLLALELAVPPVYGRDARWTSELKAGTVTFSSSPGWQQALEELIEMNDAGCFEPGATATSEAAAEAEFAQAEGLMYVGYSSHKGAIDADSAQFSYSFEPFPGGSSAGATATFVHPGNALSVNAHASPANQAAARAFIDFLGRPKENALYTQITGGLTQYEFLKGELSGFMSAFATVLAKKEYVVDPSQDWWNANVDAVLQQDVAGLLTGQETVDGVLNAMDAAWKQGSS